MGKNRLWLLSAALGWSLSAVLPAQAVPGWVMSRQNGLGVEIITASKDGVLIEYPQADYNVVCKAPSWDVTWYSKVCKTKYTKSLAKFRIDKGLPATSTTVASVPRRVTKYAGIRAFKERVTMHDFEQPDATFGGVSGGRPSQGVCTDFYYSDPVAVPPQAMLFLNTFMGTRNYPCFPLASESVDAAGQTRKIWYTKSLAETEVPSNKYAVPANCVAGPTQLSVTSGGGYRQAFDDLATGMKIGEGFGTKGKQPAAVINKSAPAKGKP